MADSSKSAAPALRLPMARPEIATKGQPISLLSNHFKVTDSSKSAAPALCLPMARPGIATKGQPISLLSNHFKVTVARTDRDFYQYSVAIKYEDETPVDAKGIGRKVIEKLQETYSTELAGMEFAYDGEHTLFTIGPLPRTKLEFTVVLEEQSAKRKSSPGADGSPREGDKKRSKRQPRMKPYNVAIKYATKISIMAIANALRGQETEQFQEAVRVLDIILRQHASKQGCLLVRQSFFHNEPRNFVPVGGGVLGCRGFYSSFRATQSGLSLNMDVTTTMIVKPGPVMDFLIENQSVRDPSMINWEKAKRTLKNLRVQAMNTNLEYKIRGLSDKICKEQMFSMRQRGNDGRETEMSVYEYFVRNRDIPLRYSGDFPCIDVGKPKRPTYIPIELCSLVSLQRYTKAMTNLQRAALVEKSRQKPQERMGVLKQAFNSSKYESDTLLRSCGISISRDFTRVEGRVLVAPKLKVGRGDEIIPRNGRWNFNNKKLIEPFTLSRWVIVNFSARCDMRRLSSDLIRCAQMKGMTIEPPYTTIEENPQARRRPAPDRVEEMAGMMRAKLPGPPQLVLCILPERKNSDIYGPWKRKNLSELGIATQCISPPQRGFNDQYLTNLLLKINAKLGGINSLLGPEHSHSIPMVSQVPTLIVGMDVSHGSPGRSDVPSIAAVVNSRQWPLISRYRATVRTQPPKMEMIGNLIKVNGDKDDGIFSEVLMDYYKSSKVKPEHIIIFRDGVSESQFNQVLNIELQQIIEACKFKDATWNPKFTLIVAQKNHHTKFFQPTATENVPPGTVVDNGVCHPKNYDFYMCSQAGMIGTTRPTHYHVLYDEIGFSPDDLQALVHSLSYVYQRSTTAISVVAPICYAHLAAAQVSQFIKFDEFSDHSSNHGGGSSQGGADAAVPQLPVLHDNVSSSMFFC